MKELTLTEESKSISNLQEYMPNETLMTSLMCQHEARQITSFAIFVIHFQVVLLNLSPTVAIEDPEVMWDDVPKDMNFQRSSVVFHPSIQPFTHHELLIALTFAKPAGAIAAFPDDSDLLEPL